MNLVDRISDCTKMMVLASLKISLDLCQKKKFKKRYVKFLKKTVWTSQLKLICILQIICMWHLIWKLENIICIENKIRVYNIFTNLEQELKNLENFLRRS